MILTDACELASDAFHRNLTARRKILNFACNHAETASSFAGARCLYGRIQRDQSYVETDLVNFIDGAVNDRTRFLGRIPARLLLFRRRLAKFANALRNRAAQRAGA